MGIMTGWNPASMPRTDVHPPRVRRPSPDAHDRAARDAVTARTIEDTATAPSESLTISVETVRPERKADFDRLLDEVIRPVMRRRSPDAATWMRTLGPSAANDDGSWTYVTIYETAVVSVDAWRRRLLEAAYGCEAAAEHERLYRDCRLGDAVVYKTVKTVR